MGSKEEKGFESRREMDRRRWRRRWGGEARTRCRGLINNTSDGPGRQKELLNLNEPPEEEVQEQTKKQDEAREGTPEQGRG
jgi:hypothetical protein